MTFASAIYQGECIVLNALMENIKGEVISVYTRKEYDAKDV